MQFIARRIAICVTSWETIHYYILHGKIEQRTVG